MESFWFAQKYLVILEYVVSAHRHRHRHRHRQFSTVTVLIKKVIAAEGEHKASRALRHAAEVIAECPAALQVIIQLMMMCKSRSKSRKILNWLWIGSRKIESGELWWSFRLNNDKKLINKTN